MLESKAAGANPTSSAGNAAKQMRRHLTASGWLA